MPPAQRRVMRIIKDFKRPSVFNIYATAYLKIITLLLFPLWAKLCLNDQVSNDLKVGDNTRKLIQDYVGWEKQPKITSTWMEQDSYINGSTYQQSHFNNLYIIAMCYTLYDWEETYAQTCAIIFLIFRFSYHILEMLMFKYGWKRLVLFVIVCVLLNVYLILGVWSFLQLMHALFENVIRWIDSKLHDATYSLGLSLPLSQRTTHPFTSGNYPPYYLYTFNRYLKEDVKFTCEYLVFSLKNALPIYRRANWRKNGSPVTANDRIYVNMSINELNETLGQIFAQYSVTSTLTIEMIEEEDFGSYTCEYYNPMQIFARPGPSMDEGYEQEIPGKPTFPNPACKCHPQGRQELFRNDGGDGEMKQFEGSSQYQSVEPWETNLFQCFAEFSVKKIASQTITVDLNPGSVLVDGAVYTSIADVSELEYDVTFSNEDSNRDNCCSKLVMLYWGLFRRGTFNTPPFTRIRTSGNSKYFYRYQCLCPHSYGIRQFSFSRKYFNHTTRTYDMTDIVYPVTLRILPNVTHPWSSNNSTEYIHNGTTCWDGLPSDSHITQICSHFYSILEMTLDVIIFYDTLIINIAYFAVAVWVLFVPLMLHLRCVRPILTACLTFGRRETSLVALTGQNLTYNLPRVDQTTELHADDVHYQIFLSYDENNDFDLMTAQVLKGLLLTLKLSVFDFNSDVPLGEPMLQATGKAIDKSYRFVVIASTSYMENDLKVMEFDYIQQAICGQASKLKDRLIIIHMQPCDIVGVYRVPCIEITALAQQIDTLDQRTLQQFLTWESCTRPSNIVRPPGDYYRNLKETVTIQLIVPIFIVLSVLFVILLSLRL